MRSGKQSPETGGFLPGSRAWAWRGAPVGLFLGARAVPNLTCPTLTREENAPLAEGAPYS